MFLPFSIYARSLGPITDKNSLKTYNCSIFFERIEINAWQYN